MLLEILKLQPGPIAKLHQEREGLWGKYPIIYIGLNRPRPEIYRRVEARIEQMFERGVVDEVRQVLALPLSKTARVAIGVPEVGGFLKGEYDVERAKYLMKLHTRHYVKRQMTWFRKDKRVVWMDIAERESNQDMVKKIERIMAKE